MFISMCGFSRGYMKTIIWRSKLPASYKTFDFSCNLLVNSLPYATVRGLLGDNGVRALRSTLLLGIQAVYLSFLTSW
jgi:hypothetical protein